jgi:DNA polymerase-3 subunit delta'
MNVTFTAIIGHDRPVGILRRALANDALAHAYLFSGEPGIGKRMTALAFAAALNCVQPRDRDACGTCPSCRKVSSGNHPDVHVMAADGDEIKIDQVREVQTTLSLRPFEGRRKVLIVDGAEDLNEASSNSFLKTLEEPPGESLIILVTAMPQRLLATIRSRCQALAFQPLPRSVLAPVLRERRGLSEEDAWFLAALSRGSIGRALEMDLDEERTGRERFRTLMHGITGLKPDEVLSLAEGVAKDREGFERLIEIGIEWLRDRIVLAETGDEQLLVVPAAAEHGSGGDVRRGAPARMLRDLDLFTSSRTLLERRVSPQLVAENLFLKLGRD